MPILDVRTIEGPPRETVRQRSAADAHQGCTGLPAHTLAWSGFGQSPQEVTRGFGTDPLQRPDRPQPAQELAFVQKEGIQSLEQPGHALACLGRQIPAQTRPQGGLGVRSDVRKLGFGRFPNRNRVVVELLDELFDPISIRARRSQALAEELDPA